MTTDLNSYEVGSKKRGGQGACSIDLIHWEAEFEVNGGEGFTPATNVRSEGCD